MPTKGARQAPNSGQQNPPDDEIADGHQNPRDDPAQSRLRDGVGELGADAGRIPPTIMPIDA